MSAPFEPPARSCLATVDVAEGVEYDGTFTVIEGVVAPGGQGGWPDRHGRNFEIQCFSFAGWRRPGEQLLAHELTILRPIPPIVNNDYSAFEEVPDYSIQRLNVLLSKDQTRAIVEKLLTIDEPDEALLSLSDRLRIPVVVSTARFGDLVLNPQLPTWFEGKGKWNRKTIDLRLEKSQDGGLDDAIKIAETLWSDQAAWKRKVDDFAVEDLLPLKNEDWLGEDETKVTPKEFKSRMKLVSISVDRGGRFRFWHDDGDLFWGHAIEVSGTLKDGLTQADIPG